MSVTTETSEETAIGSGSPGPFTFNFRFFSVADITVKKISVGGETTVLSNGVDYTLTGAGSNNGGKVVLSDVLPVGYSLNIVRNTDLTQRTVFRNQGSFYPEIHEDALDKLALAMQDRERRISDLEETDEVQDDRLDTAEGTIFAHSGRLDSVEADITSLEGRATTVEGRADALEGRATAVEGRATDLENRTTELEGEVSSLNLRATALEGRASAAEGRLTEAESDITALQANETSQGERLANVETTVASLISGIPSFLSHLQDATAGQVFVDVVAANDPTAKVIIVGKLDDSANSVTVRPAAGTVGGLATWDVDTSGSATMFVPNATTNNYLKIG